MSDKVQEFLDEEIIKHAEKMGFAFLLKQEELLDKIIERFSLSRSKAVWEMTVFIQNNAGPTGDLAVIASRRAVWPRLEPPSAKGLHTLRTAGSDCSLALLQLRD